MLRSLICLAVASAVFASAALAADPAKKKKKQAAAAAASAVSGEIVKVDADKGTITLKVPGRKKKDPAEEKEFKVTPETAVALLAELKADKVADLLKKDEFKAGTAVKVEAGDDGAAKSVTLGGPAPTPMKKKKKDA
ncbi:MAG: hypothetical protein ACRC33_20765, partial [Gemmataceae bacterium]